MPIRTNIHSHRHIAIVKRRLPKLAANWLRGLFETMQARRPCKRSSHYFRAYHCPRGRCRRLRLRRRKSRRRFDGAEYVCVRALVQMQCACSCGF